jgi:small subunit ribosomal protein S18
MIRQPQKIQVKNEQCYFCVHGIREIDYKELRMLQKFVSPYAKIMPRRRTGVCSKHQRKLAMAVKRARFLALLPFVAR